MPRPVSRRLLGSARLLGPTLLVLGAALTPGAAPHAAPPPGDHATAAAALADIQAARKEIVSAANDYSTDPEVYRRADQRAINALTGTHADDYDAAAGNPGDAQGALGHIDALLDRRGTPAWTVALHGVEANLRAAAARLREAKAARELMDHQIAMSAALENILAAIGRPTEAGVFGGLEGAMATTTLGVPAGGAQVDACAVPQAGPAYGTHDGQLAFVALPLAPGQQRLPEALGTTRVEIRDNLLILHTAAAPAVARLCAQKTAATTPSSAQPAGGSAQGAAPAQASAQPAAQSSSGGAAGAGTGGQAAAGAAQPSGGATASASPQAAASGGGTAPALYTKAQAKAGKTVYQQHCVSCHGANLQGTAAPSVAGKDFLHTAKENGWTLQTIRFLVFTMMPFNAPRSLTAQQYADVMAYLLATNCYPAGKTPFPTQDESSFKTIQLGPLPGQQPGENAQGVCPVK